MPTTAVWGAGTSRSTSSRRHVNKAGNSSDASNSGTVEYRDSYHSRSSRDVDSRNSRGVDSQQKELQ